MVSKKNVFSPFCLFGFKLALFAWDSFKWTSAHPYIGEALSVWNAHYTPDLFPINLVAKCSSISCLQILKENILHEMETSGIAQGFSYLIIQNAWIDPTISY